MAWQSTAKTCYLACTFDTWVLRFTKRAHRAPGVFCKIKRNMHMHKNKQIHTALNRLFCGLLPRFYRVSCFLSKWVSGKDKTLLWMRKVLGMDLPWRLEDWGGGVNHCFLLLFCYWQRDQGLFAIIVMFQMLWTTVQDWYRGSRADPETRSLRDSSWEIRLLPILLLDLRYERKPWEVRATVFSTTLPQN